MTNLGNSATLDRQVYVSVSDSAAELVLQPRHGRNQAMRKAWFDSILFVLLVLPILAILPPMFIAAIFSIISGSVVPGFISAPLTIAWFAAMAKFGWDILCTNGYRTLIFDRVQQQFVTNIANIFGRNYQIIIPFDRIEDAQFHECDEDGMSVEVFLTLKERENYKSQPIKEKIVLSRFSSEEYRTVANLTLRQEHQELLLLVRTALGFSTKAILYKLQHNPPIPTAEELQQEKAQALLAAREQIQHLTKAIFTGRQDKQERLGTLRSQTLQFPEDPQIWQDFALQLAMQKNPPKAEIIDAYRQAEALYLDRGDTERASAMAKTIEGIK